MPFTRAYAKRLAGAVLVCSGALVIAPGSAAAASKGCRPPKGAFHFFSAPRLKPPRIHVCTRKKGTAHGMVFLGPFKDALYSGSFVGQAGALMVDQGGHPVWFHRAPKGEQDSNFTTQTYGATSQPVLSFWQGRIEVPRAGHTPPIPAGTSLKGSFYIYNDRYQRIKTVKARGKGWVTDFHELILTKPSAGHPQGTAIFWAAKKVRANLRRYGGAAKGSYEDMEVQQIDLATDKLIFHWDVHKHIALSASRVHAPSKGVWDPYHANSINVATGHDSIAAAGDLLISLRNTWGVYDLKPSGAFRWKLINGKGTNFKLSKSARFFWQHDARFHGGNQISMFDDGCCNLGVSGPEHAARGLVLSLSKAKKSATVVRQYRHPSTREVPTGGNLQTLSDGHAFIGWGQSYFYSEYTAKGSMIYDAAIPKPDMSYRTIKAMWSATPFYRPSAAARKVKHKTTVYASWNGATAVARWKVLAGRSPKRVTAVAGQAKRSGFETAIHVTAKGPYYEVQALDSHGKPIPGGTSKPVKAR